MAVTDSYTAEVERDGRFWLVWVPEVERVTQARNLREVEPIARDLVAMMLEIAPDSFDLEIHIKLPADVAEHLSAAQRLREESARANSAAAEEARAAAQALAEAGLPLRDIGIALGVSHQRAHQLLGTRAS